MPVDPCRIRIPYIHLNIHIIHISKPTRDTVDVTEGLLPSQYFHTAYSLERYKGGQNQANIFSLPCDRYCGIFNNIVK